MILHHGGREIAEVERWDLTTPFTHPKAVARMCERGHLWLIRYADGSAGCGWGRDIHITLIER